MYLYISLCASCSFELGLATGDTIAGRILSGVRSLFLEYRLPNITVAFCGHSSISDEEVKEELVR